MGNGNKGKFDTFLGSATAHAARALQRQELDNSSPKSGLGRRGQIEREVSLLAEPKERFLLDLPVTKTKLECELLNLDPGDCFVTPLNSRKQSLLREDDPEIVVLKDQIEGMGQTQPILVRPVVDPLTRKTRYELIYGSRRRFVCESLKRTVKAWCGDVPDIDVRPLTKYENDGHVNPCVWEQAMDLVGVKKNLYKGKKDETIFELEGHGRTKGYDLLKLASLPEAFVERMESPQGLSIESGCKLVNLVSSLSEDDRGKLLNELNKQPRFQKGKDLLSAVKKILASWSSPKEKKLAQNGGWNVSQEDSGHVAMTVRLKRGTQTTFNITLDDFTVDEVEKITNQVAKMRKGYAVVKM